MEHLRFYAPPNLAGVSAVRATGVTNVFARHAHGALCLGLALRGARVLVLSNTETRVAPGELFLIPALEPHVCRPLGSAGHDYLALCLSPRIIEDSFAQLAGDSRPLPRFPSSLGRDAHLAAALSRLVARLETPSQGLEREEALHGVLARLLTRYASPETSRRQRALSPTRAVRTVRDHIRERCVETLRLETLSDLAGMSPFHFQRSFLRQCGLTPHEYQIQCRIRLVRSLLDQGQDIALAAQTAGFTDQSHCTRHFKRVMGTTPGRYLRSGK